MAELIWEGKYDQDGKKKAPLRVALPFQTVETVNESAQQRQKNLFAPQPARPDWRNRLIWGDKKYVLPSLLSEFAGKVDLIYIDPPFNVGADFSFQAQVGDERFTKAPSLIEQKAYRDTWGRGIDGYLQWLYETAVLLHELLAETGSLYVHLDWHVGHYVKAVLDEVFGLGNFLNEIIWKRQTAKGGAFGSLNQYGRIHETIYFYTKSETFVWNQLFTSYEESHIEKSYRHIEEGTGKRFSLRDLTAAGVRKGESGKPIEVNGEVIPVPPGRHWAIGLKKDETVQQGVDRLVSENLIWHRKGGMPRLKLYLEKMPGVPLQSIWTDIKPVQAQSNERLDYNTQKPETLLERIIQASSNEDDLVLDCFCGSGTTAAVSEKMNRRWIVCDLGRFSIHTTRKRLLEIDGVRPFVVQNLGKYERQVWQHAEFGERAEATVFAYRKFILDLYHADQITGFAWLHGKKGGRMVHVGSVDSPVTHSDVQQIAIEFRKAIGRGKDAPQVAGVDVLGWDFALDMNETVRQIAKEASLDVRFIKIPREVLERKAVEQGDIRFFELAALGVELTVKARQATVKLTDFMVPPDDVPADVLKAVKHWSEWIDYWAVDFNFRDDTFHNEWQSYRTRKERKLELKHSHIYAAPGVYTVLVKVIDILGNDTTKALRCDVQ